MPKRTNSVSACPYKLRKKNTVYELFISLLKKKIPKCLHVEFPKSKSGLLWCPNSRISVAKVSCEITGKKRFSVLWPSGRCQIMPDSLFSQTTATDISPLSGIFPLPIPVIGSLLPFKLQLKVCFLPLPMDSRDNRGKVSEVLLG